MGLDNFIAIVLTIIAVSVCILIGKCQDIIKLLRQEELKEKEEWLRKVGING